jgi:hypothetical protein
MTRHLLLAKLKAVAIFVVNGYGADNSSGDDCGSIYGYGVGDGALFDYSSFNGDGDGDGDDYGCGDHHGNGSGFGYGECGEGYDYGYVPGSGELQNKIMRLENSND